ncbi:hypothetical protein M405DRAFT_827369 [Rhizopogon salebrosus TDB-379]|nr:hypothetical protein M405DRAFT_827369 [Rhizopogon salebrosus TDB-379]
MARFLLDGRNPQPYRDAVKRFNDLQFGRVSRGLRVQGTYVQDYQAGNSIHSC